MKKKLSYRDKLLELAYIYNVKEIQKLLDDKHHLKGILKKGSEKANIIAEENLKNIRDIVGLI